MLTRSGAGMLWAAGAAAALISTGCIEPEKPFRVTPEVVLPQSVHSHPWMLKGEPAYYDATNLEEYIDGAARPYLEYGVIRLIHAIYFHKANPSREMIVDVYEMVSPLAAYGIYSTQRPEEADDVRLGTSGFWSPGLLCFVKSRIFTAIQPPGESARDMASAMLIAGYVEQATRLPLDRPAMLSAIPEEVRVKNSEKYLAQNMLGYRFLGRGWMATYRHRGVKHGLFIVVSKDATRAIERYEELAETVQKGGKIIRRITGIGRAALIGTSESFGRIFVACSGKYLVGTTDCFDDERSITLSRQVLDNITRIGL